VKLASSNKDAVWKLLFNGITPPSESATDDMETESAGDSKDHLYVFHCTNVQDIEMKSARALQKRSHADTLLREYCANVSF
jgi:hypothetical protein